MSKRVAAYVRVSTTKQEYDLQMEAIQRALPGPIEIEDIYSDTASAWRKVKRPGLDKLLHDADAGKLRGATLYVFALSRLTRKGTRDTLQTLDRLALGGVAVVSVTENYINTTDANPFRDVILALFATVAKLESQAKSDRMRAWAQVKRKAGERMGRKPVEVPRDVIEAMAGGKLSIGEAVKKTGISRNTVRKALRKSVGESA